MDVFATDEQCRLAVARQLAGARVCPNVHVYHTVAHVSPRGVDHPQHPVHVPARRPRAAPEGSMQKVYRALGITFLFLVAISGTALSQGQQVSGTVTSATSGEKLWGVTVRLKGTQTQTVTNQQGQYSLVAPAAGVLTFAQIGYRNKEAPINGQSTVDMTLEQAPTMLQEVVVTGYTSQRRSDITGAVSSVNIDNISQQTSASVLQRLNGRVPGVTAVSSGSPGSRTTVRIRGVSSFHDNDPLYIIDGTPVQDSYINFLNPNDIGELQVLKDASSASIYGSRASTGVATPTKGMDDVLMMNSLDYFHVIKRSYLNAGVLLDSVHPEVKAIYGDPANPQVPVYTYVNTSARDTVDQWGRPV